MKLNNKQYINQMSEGDRSEVSKGSGNKGLIINRFYKFVPPSFFGSV